MSKFTNCLWFAKDGEKAAEWYVSLFPNSRITQVQKYDAQVAKASGQPEGAVLLAAFELDGQRFLALNGGNQPWASSSGFISFIVECDDQKEIDHYWNAFADGGKPMQCGWVTDRFGVTWQVIPAKMSKWMSDPVHGKAVTAAMLEMEKIVIADLEAAAR